MNIPAGLYLDKAAPPISLRPERPDDEALLFAVFASTREEELALTNWDAATRQAFLRQQFAAMRQGYRGMFPTGEFLIVELAGQPVGRLVVNQSENEVRVVDIALLPAQRNQQIGTVLMRQICAAAAKPVRLSVFKNNRASDWYQRLGFTRTGEQGFYDELEWRPPNLVSPAG